MVLDSPHRHLIIRDSGALRSRSGGWLNEKRWTMSHKATSIRAACMGLGFAWYPEENIREELSSDALRPLPLAEGRERFVTLYLVYADPDPAGPGARHRSALARGPAARGEAAGGSRTQRPSAVSLSGWTISIQ